MAHLNPFYLSSFKSSPPRFKAGQEQIVEFLKKRESGINQKLISRYSVKSHQVNQRHFEIPDMFLSENEMLIYGSERANIQKRTEFFSNRAKEIFDSLYDEDSETPDHLIHVTCTGYVAPSASQNFVVQRGWNTEITHAYHMGCYAAFPSVRLAWGLSQLGKNVEIVHTEMCSLHMNPTEYTPEQIVVHTLFADGHIKYKGSSTAVGKSLQVLRVKERLIPNTNADMTWMPAPFGMKMTLSRDVPQKIAGEIKKFTSELIEESGLSFASVLKEGIFAIHPGGPRIIDTLSEVLELKEDQIQASRQILFERGNMSSATLPHIWQRLLASEPASGVPVISLGFGPGLTMFGAVFEVC